VSSCSSAPQQHSRRPPLDFNEYASPVTTEYEATIGAPLTAGGLDFYNTSLFWANARNALATWGTEDDGAVNIPTNVGGSTTLFSTSLGSAGGIDIFAAGANPVTGEGVRAFGLQSMDVSHLFASQYLGGTSLGTINLRVFGLRLGATPMEFFQDFVIGAPAGGIPTLQTLMFDSRFGEVHNVWWTQGGTSATAHQFTNVVATPEPGSILLMATGLAGMAWLHRRRRRDLPV
jgi:hypothetical protein